MTGRDIAESLKEKGNEFYKTSFFAEAEDAYSKALNEVVQDEDPKLVLRATIYSNRANARFEMGNYSGAADDSRNAIGVIQSDGKVSLDDEKNHALLSKNEWRLARCLFYDQRNEELKALVAAKEAESDSIFLEKVKCFTKSMQFKEKLHSSSEEFSPQILRSNLSFPFCEHYPFGHDNAESLLEEGKIEPNCQFNILFGGVGDARHAFTTILDHHYHRVKKSLDFNLHITMNDINTAVLVKDILVLVLSYRIGILLADFEPRSGNVIDALEKNSEAFLMMTVMYYGTQCYAMPPAIYEKLQSLVTEIFLDSSHASFQEKYPWLFIREKDWLEFQRVAKHWVDISMYDPPLEKTKVFLRSHKPEWEKPDLGSIYRGSNHDPNNISVLKRMRDDDEASDRAWHRERLSESFDASQIGAAIITADLTAEEREKAKQTQIDSLMAMIYDPTLKYELDQMFMKETNVLLPPITISIPGLEGEVAMKSRLDSCFHARNGNLLKTRLREAKKEVHKRWKVNPIKIDPSWHSYTGGQNRDNANPVTEFPLMYFHCDIHRFILAGLGGEYENGNYEILSLDPLNGSLFNCFSLFFVNTGLAIANSVKDSRIALEISLGSILTLHSESRNFMGFPKSFHKISLSNIPDYTGLLSVLVHVGKLLDTSMIGSSMRAGVLLNCGLFRSYDEYVFGTTSLSTNNIGRFLQMRCLDEVPHVRNHYNVWGVDTLQKKTTPVTLIEFKTWIHGLFLHTLFPSLRDSQSTMREEHPNTIGLILQTCKYCIEHLGYPPHWITTSLDSLLSREGILKTKAMLLNKSPSPVLVQKKMMSYNISAVQLDLRNQLAIFLHHELIPDNLVAIAHLPQGQPKRYVIDLGIYPFHIQQSNPCVSCIGFILEKKKNKAYRSQGSLGMMAMYAEMFGGEPDQAKPGQLRDDLLNKGNRIGHLFSSMQYNLKARKVSFDMCEDVFEQHKDFYLSLVRTDSWQILDHANVFLRDAIFTSEKEDS